MIEGSLEWVEVESNVLAQLRQLMDPNRLTELLTHSCAGSAGTLPITTSLYSELYSQLYSELYSELDCAT